MPMYYATIKEKSGNWLDEVSAMGEYDIREEVRLWVRNSEYELGELEINYWRETV